MNRTRLSLAVLLLAVAATSCSSSPAAPVKAAAAPAGHTEPAAGDPVPAPTGTPVLRLFGKIATTNGSDGLSLDLAGIERLGLVSVELNEPFQKRRMGFRGVPLAAVLDLARADASATGIHMVALDDYSGDFRLAQARVPGLILATRAGDGSPLAVEDGGPTRLVFADGTPGGADTNSWVWSIATVEVR